MQEKLLQIKLLQIKLQLIFLAKSYKTRKRILNVVKLQKSGLDIPLNITKMRGVPLQQGCFGES
jgi:hypothetical protein